MNPNAADQWSRYEPSAARPWTLAMAAHLLRRAGFGAGWDQLQQALAAGPQQTVDRLLNDVGRASGLPHLDFDALGASVAASEGAGSDDSAELWLYRMIQTPHALLEKITLFWHNYFAVAGERVRKASLVEQHLRLLRRHALGKFDAMLQDICRDPATLLALGSSANRKARPSDEFAAALLGLYTAGPGSFSASDVRDTARAFTGTFVLRNEFRYLPNEHDEGTKTVLGRQGNFGGEDVVRVVLAHPATPRLVVRRMYRWLIAETGEPTDELLAPPAESFAKDYDIAKLVGTMLRSNLFFSDAAYRQRVKSPLEFALGIATAFEAPAAAAPLHRQLAALGQKLLEPPTRQGWPGGRRWLNSFTVVGRGKLAATLLAAVDPQALAQKHGQADTSRFLTELLLQNAETALSAQPRQLAQALVTSPEFQLA